MFKEEKTHGTLKKPEFSICCAEGKVTIPELPVLPELLTKLLSISHFRDNIRIYNASFAFVSFNATVDPKLRPYGVYCALATASRHGGMVRSLI